MKPLLLHRLHTLGYRSHIISNLPCIGSKVTLAGWVNNVRHQKDIDFIELRDFSGIIPVVCEFPSHRFREEDVLKVHGTVQARMDGNLEILANHVQVENSSQHPLPLNPSQKKDDNAATPQQRDASLRFRYLELRRPELQQNLRLRAECAQAMRQFMINECGFLEVETPTLFKSTPEGAKEFLVPVQQPKSVEGNPKFFALTQSPQQYKQLLMVGGIDRYFQFARCYRDEGGRSDRQPEFTQMDMEMSFIESCQDIELIIEGVVKKAWEVLSNSKYNNLGVSEVKLLDRFPRFTLKECMERYGTDKPDMSFGMTINNEGELVCPGLALGTSRSEREQIRGKQVRMELLSDGGDVRFHHASSREELGSVRTRCAAMMRMKNMDLPRGELEERQPFWVYDFPMFERNKESPSSLVQACHHPFTSPLQEDLEKFQNSLKNGNIEELLECRGNHVDLVCDGLELGGGSVRIHNYKMQRNVFVKVLGLSEEECDSKFGQLLQALEFGAPPHGGFAIGFDRFMAWMTKSSSLSRVLAFPKSSSGTDPMSNAPSELHNQDLMLEPYKLRSMVIR